MKPPKKVNVEISYETWKRLKMIAVSRDITLHYLITEMLDKHVNSKKVENILEDNE